MSSPTPAAAPLVLERLNPALCIPGSLGHETGTWQDAAFSVAPPLEKLISDVSVGRLVGGKVPRSLQRNPENTAGMAFVTSEVAA